MKTKASVWTAIGLAALLLMPVSALAAPGGGSGGGSGGGHGSGIEQGSGGGRGNSNPGVTKGGLYGDLYIIVRDLNGVPVLYEWDWADAENPVPEEDAKGFVQPIAIPESEWGGLGLADLPDSCYSEDLELWLVPMNEEGEVAEGYEDYTQEVELGRLNLARAPEAILEAGYEEALNAINSASDVSSDPAGRLLLVIDGEEKTIDSPRENLALYKVLMTE